MADRSQHHFNRRLLLTTLLGTSIGFGLGYCAHALWKYLHDRTTRPNRFPRSDERSLTDKLNEELTSLKSEVAALRQMLTDVSSARPTLDRFSDEMAPFYLSDEDDEFFDAENADTSAQSIQPDLPQVIMDELDQLADIAMGEDALAASTPRVGVGELRLGSQAYARCLVYRKAYRRSPEFLWRFARATYLASTEAYVEDEPGTSAWNDSDAQNDALSSASSRTLNDLAYELASRRQFVENGLAVARRALSIANRSQGEPYPISVPPSSLGEIYKWLAVMVGLACEFVGMSQRITYGVEFKELIDKAIEFNPDDPHSHHLRGRWCYQVYNLTWIERKLASRLFGTPPTATLEEALADFEETERIRPDYFAANQLYLAKCYISQSDYNNAAKWLHKAKDLIDQRRYPSPHLDDMEVQSEIQALFPKYASYEL